MSVAHALPMHEMTGYFAHVPSCVLHTHTFNGNTFLVLTKHLVALKVHWIPHVQVCSLYIQPTLIGMGVATWPGGMGVKLCSWFCGTMYHCSKRV